MPRVNKPALNKATGIGDRCAQYKKPTKKSFADTFNINQNSKGPAQHHRQATITTKDKVYIIYSNIDTKRYGFKNRVYKKDSKKEYILKSNIILTSYKTKKKQKQNLNRIIKI